MFRGIFAVLWRAMIGSVIGSLDGLPFAHPVQQGPKGIHTNQRYSHLVLHHPIANFPAHQHPLVRCHDGYTGPP